MTASLLLMHVNCFSQTKGIAVINTDYTSPSRTYALVIGISHYKNIPGIPPLRYAHQDAIDFANLLEQSNTCKKTDILLLTDDSATATNVYYLGLKKLVRDAKAGETVIIYFSGHGDVDNEISSGFLLTYGCVKGIYEAGDALPLSRLQWYVNLLSDKKVKVVLITDACRSGALTGSKETLTTLNGFSNVVKILSCQPNELSEEKFYNNYGVGHGVFTRYLLEGLSGLADKNNDQVVTLKELKRYIEDKMEVETGGRQNPVVEGDQNTVLISVDTALKNAMSVRNEGLQNPVSKSLVVRGSVDKTETRTIAENELVNKFYSQLKLKHTIAPKGDNAYETILKAKEQNVNPELLEDLSWQLAAILEDNAQQWLNKLLLGDITFANTKREHVEELISQLDITLVLIGTKDERYNEIKAKYLFFKAFSIRSRHSTGQYALALNLAQEADSIMPNQAYLQNFLGRFGMFLNGPTKQTEKYLLNAIRLAPKWSWPYLNLSDYYFEEHDSTLGTKYLLRLMQMDSLGYYILTGGLLLTKNPKDEKGLEYNFRALKIDSNNLIAIRQIYSYYAMQYDFSNAQRYLDKMLTVSTDSKDIGLAAFFYYDNKKFDKAEPLFRKAIELDSMYSEPYIGLWYLFTDRSMTDSASLYLHKAISVDPINGYTYYYIASYYIRNNLVSEALTWLEMALKLDLLKIQPNVINYDPDWIGLKDDERLKKLVAKYASQN